MPDNKKFTDWKFIAQQWKMLALTQNMAIAAVANDKLYECRCGDPPYTDGDMCPQCFCTYVQTLMKKRYKQSRRHIKEHCKRREADDV